MKEGECQADGARQGRLDWTLGSGRASAPRFGGHEMGQRRGRAGALASVCTVRAPSVLSWFVLMGGGRWPTPPRRSFIHQGLSLDLCSGRLQSKQSRWRGTRESLSEAQSRPEALLMPSGRRRRAMQPALTSAVAAALPLRAKASSGPGLVKDRVLVEEPTTCWRDVGGW